MTKRRRAHLERLRELGAEDRKRRCAYCLKGLPATYVIRLLTGQRFCNADCEEGQLQRERLEAAR